MIQTTEVNEYEICREYRTAKHKSAQIGILADLYLITREEVREILVRNGLIEEKKKAPARVSYTPKLYDKVRRYDARGLPQREIAKRMKMSSGQIGYMLYRIRHGKQTNGRS